MTTVSRIVFGHRWSAPAGWCALTAAQSGLFAVDRLDLAAGLGLGLFISRMIGSGIDALEQSE